MLETPDNEAQDLVEADNEAASRDSVLSRWTKFISIIAMGALLGGVLFGISIHVAALHLSIEYEIKQANHYYVHQSAPKNAVEQSNADTKHAFKIRFIVGSIIGGSSGLIYTIRCLVKDVDP
jgi:hypothetical protein